MELEELELEKLKKSEGRARTQNGGGPTPAASGFWAELTLEPAMAGVLTALFLTTTTQLNLYMRTACLRDLRHPPHLCDGGVGEEFRKVELETQEHISALKAPRGLVLAVTVAAVMLFVLPWSDVSRRRKPLVLLSLLGLSLSSLNALLLLTFPYLSAGWVMYIVQLPSAMGGDIFLFIAAGFCFIGDVCNVTGRDPVIVFATNRAAGQCARILGSLGGPFIYRHLGFYGVYSTALLLQVSSLVFVMWRVRDVDPNTEMKVSALDVRLPVAALRSLVTPRRRYRRICVLMMALVAMMDSSMLEAEDLLSFMYFRNKFLWDDVTFGCYKAFQSTVLFSGTLLTMRLLRERLRMTDEMIGVVSGVSFAARELCLIGANTTPLAFLAPVVGLVSSGSMIVPRTILNKHIDISEQGKVHSAVGALGQAFNAIVIPAFPLLYSRTAATAPDAWIGVFVTQACLQTALFLLAYFLQRAERGAGCQPGSVANATETTTPGPEVPGQEGLPLMEKMAGVTMTRRAGDETVMSDGTTSDSVEN